MTGGPGTPDALFHFTVLGIITTAANVPIWETLALNRVVVRPTGAPATSDFLLPPPSLYPDLTSDVFVQHLVVSINLTTFALNDQAAPVQIRL